MIVGVDFDNTVVCYDELFHRVGVEQGLIPASVPPTKEGVRGYLESQGQGDVWTELQGYVYGPRLAEAPPFPGVLEFFRACSRSDVAVCIVSHKTRLPARGPGYDLHRSARQWLESQGFHDPKGIGLPRERVYLEQSQQEKVERIAQTGCAFFIDDLPELLQRPDFPPTAQRILFDPHGRHSAETDLHPTTSWAEIEQLIRCCNPPS